jgi:ferredoxin
LDDEVVDRHGDQVDTYKKKLSCVSKAARACPTP